ncbi:MAG: biopolymer transporter ExbD [Verrucomicrobiales bacterium]|nr:biopolymer transporter ExbD [Verrucomicrobiales bacterium]
MKLQSTLTLRPDFLYLAPLLNIVLLLLIFFLLNSNFVVRSGIRVELPVSASSLKPVERWHIITITGGESPAVYLNEKQIFTGDLAPALEAIKSETRYVLVNADQSVAQGIVQRVQNAVLAAGCELAMGTQVQP